jgi:hypothetical protein
MFVYTDGKERLNIDGNMHEDDARRHERRLGWGV